MSKRSKLSTVTVALTAAWVMGCGGAPADARFPARPEGCDVQIVHEDAPNVPTENIGRVSASCTDLTSDDDCYRTLKDQVCKLGGDVVWGVEPAPVIKDGKKRLTGRAAKARSPSP